VYPVLDAVEVLERYAKSGEGEVSFSLPKFLRRLPTESLKGYFDERGYAGTQIVWDTDQPKMVEQIRTVIDGLPEEERHRVFDDFERAYQLSDDIGQRALRGMLFHMPELLDAISQTDTHEGRALFALLREPDAFEHALSVAYADHLQFGRSWNRFSAGKSGLIDNSPTARDILSKEIGRLFDGFDGSGREVHIDVFERANKGLLASAGERVLQYNVEKLPETSLEFGEHGPARRTYRPVREAAICLDCATGILDVLSEGGKDLREKIASAFARIVLRNEAALEPVRRRDFYLERLKQPIGFPTDPKDRIVDVAVTQIGLAASDAKSGRITIDVGRNNNEDIYAASERWFGDAEPIGRLDWRVVHAKIRIVFESEEAGRRRKVVTAELRTPNASNLKNQTWRHQLVSETYIERWGLAAPA
jgi:hypothetical protein